MARVIEERRTIAATPQALWADLVDPQAFSEWFAFCDDVEVDEEGRWVLLGSWGAQRSAVTVETTTVDAPRHMAYRHVSEELGGRPAPRLSIETTVDFVLEAAPDGGTDVTITSRQVPRSGAARLMARLFGGRAISGMLEQSLQMLAHRHEAGRG